MCWIMCLFIQCIRFESHTRYKSARVTIDSHRPHHFDKNKRSESSAKYFTPICSYWFFLQFSGCKSYSELTWMPCWKDGIFEIKHPVNWLATDMHMDTEPTDATAEGQTSASHENISIDTHTRGNREGEWKSTNVPECLCWWAYDFDK